MLLSIANSLHTGTKETNNFNGAFSEEFEIKSGVKRGCVIDLTLVGIYFLMLPKHAFLDQNGGIFTHSCTDTGLYNP
jgi:hypothetical protein